MTRLPPADDQAAPEIAAEIRARRGGTLFQLDEQLLHSPPLARGWNQMLGAVRGQLALDARLRELAICTVAVVNQAEFEFVQHAPLLAGAGATPAQLEALRQPEQAADNSSLFNETERAVMALTIMLTRRAHVDDATFERARRALGDNRLMVELVGVVATYNMVSRFLVALGIEPT